MDDLGVPGLSNPLSRFLLSFTDFLNFHPFVHAQVFDPLGRPRGMIWNYA